MRFRQGVNCRCLSIQWRIVILLPIRAWGYCSTHFNQIWLWSTFGLRLDRDFWIFRFLAPFGTLWIVWNLAAPRFGVLFQDLKLAILFLLIVKVNRDFISCKFRVGFSLNIGFVLFGWFWRPFQCNFLDSKFKRCSILEAIKTSRALILMDSLCPIIDIFRHVFWDLLQIL